MSKRKKATVLAIESSADETSAAVIKNGKIASNIIYSQIAKHAKTGGIVPEVAARAHIPKIIPAIQAALDESKTKLAGLDAVAVTAGPGLMTSLMVGVDTAKALSFALDKPIIPVNHLEGHLLSAFGGNDQFSMTNFQKNLPAVGLVVSGGHTMLVLVKGIGKYKILGETLDDAAGEAFDKIAKIMGLPYPGGPHISKLAEKGNAKKYDMPRPMLDKNNFDFSFSGLKTHVLYLWRDLIASRRSPVAELKADVSASLEQAITDVLVGKTIRAAQEYKAKTALLGGGVAANKKLRRTLKAELKKETSSELLTPVSDLTTDNAGMIGLVGYLHFIQGDFTSFDKVKVDPNLELTSWQ